MWKSSPEKSEQIRTAATALKRVLGDALVAVYLHGSAVAARLRPQSDIDLLAVVDRRMTEDQQNDLLTELLYISGRHPATPGSQRCVEVIIFLQSDLIDDRFPARAEFIYGEWLRDQFEAGERPTPASDPEYTLVLAQARQKAIPLFGPDASELLPEIPFTQICQAMRDALPSLLDGLRGDERNTLLTLARMWRTARTGSFVSKDAAAAWAIPQIPDQGCATLDYARRAYLGEIGDEWRNRFGDAKLLAEYLAARITEALWLK